MAGKLQALGVSVPHHTRVSSAPSLDQHPLAPTAVSSADVDDCDAGEAQQQLREDLADAQADLEEAEEAVRELHSEVAAQREMVSVSVIYCEVM